MAATIAAMRDEDHRLGRVSLSPDGPIVAGAIGQWTLTYVVGSYGIDEGGTIKVAWRFAADWQRPQFDDPSAPAYCSVSTKGEAKLAARYDPKGHVRPWMKCLVIDVYDGCLAPGDVVTIVLGDRSGGSPGIRAQSFIESRHELRVLVDPTNACLVARLPSSPFVEVVAGEAERVVVIVPSDALIGEAREVFVKGEDRWGNPTEAPADIELGWDGDSVACLEGRTLMFDAPGSGRVRARWRGQESWSNPIRATAEPPRFRRYWGDLHAQSDATVGTGTEVEYFTFGRDHAHLDLMSHQGNDFQMDDEDWRRLNAVVREFHRDGSFVVMPGYEWSANTAAGGDRNVIYCEEDLPILRSSHWQIDTPEDALTPAHPADDLFAKLREHVGLDEVLLMAHCGGRYADIRRYMDAELGPLVELCSCWGVFEWLLWDAFEIGARVGVVCNSDGHKGRPGAEGPGAGQFGIHGGLTCVLAESLTRAAVFAALKRRRCYGTTGPRIDLSLEVDGQPMGSDLLVDGPVELHAEVRGVGPIEALELWRGRELLERVSPPEFGDCAGSRRVRLMWGGARIRGRGRRAVWDGRIVASDGARIVDAQSVAFDSPADGIRELSEQQLRFDSRTTGDLDGIDLWLERGDVGKLSWSSELGALELDLSRLDGEGVRVDLGGLDLHVRACRYPEQPSARELSLQRRLGVEPGELAPLWVKAVQVDGHIAWASPIYVERRG